MSVKTVQAIVNGQTYTLTLNNTTGKYEATITAPATSSYNQTGHYYGVTIKATDNAGNITTMNQEHATLGEKLRLRVKEKVAPVITVVSPTSSAFITNNKPEITWKVTDTDSGVNAATIGIAIDSGAKITEGITKTAISGGYQCKYTPTAALTDGSHTVKFDASDNDGNAATQLSVTFKIDTVPPVLSISSPADRLVTNNAKCTITGTTNDVTSSPVTLTIKLNSGAAASVEVAANGAFSKEITLVNGANTITITAVDKAGKTTTVTRTVTLDTTPPAINAITITPNPVDAGKTFVISIDVTD